MEAAAALLCSFDSIGQKIKKNPSRWQLGGMWDRFSLKGPCHARVLHLLGSCQTLNFDKTQFDVAFVKTTDLDFERAISRIFRQDKKSFFLSDQVWVSAAAAADPSSAWLFITSVISSASLDSSTQFFIRFM